MDWSAIIMAYSGAPYGRSEFFRSPPAGCSSKKGCSSFHFGWQLEKSSVDSPKMISCVSVVSASFLRFPDLVIVPHSSAVK
jgi:hypothetical protein